MAYAVNNLVSAATTRGPSLRVIPISIHPKTLANVAAAPLYPTLTPMAFNTATGFWVVWATGGANGTGSIGGFLAEPTQTDAVGEVLANMLMEAKIHAGDIPTPAGQTLANLRIALRVGMRALGFDISGLDDVH